MIHHDSGLFYDIRNTITEHNQRRAHYLSLIPNYLISIFWWNKMFFHDLSFAIVSWIFRASDFLKLFMMSFKYALFF